MSGRSGKCRKDEGSTAQWRAPRGSSTTVMNRRAGTPPPLTGDEKVEDHDVSELVARLKWRNTGSFEFGPVVAVPEQHSIKAGVETSVRSISPAHSGLGMSVALPEWTASAAGWVLASVVDAARLIEPDVRDFSVRVTPVLGDGKPSCSHYRCPDTPLLYRRS